ncbi:MAG: Holliday junction branch migration protein RuvA [Desulfobacterales bacterium]
MIGYIEGKLLKKEEDRILVLAGQLGYEILLPTIVMDTFRNRQVGENISLYIYFHQTERQPKPALIGFNLEAEKEFFQTFLTVEDIGPLKAAKALTLPIRDIARAIETNDLAVLRRLKGIGARTAQKIVASLGGKMEKFALIRKTETAEVPQPEGDFVQQVLEVLIQQLGHKAPDAKRMIGDALKRNNRIATPEALFEEIYRGEGQP